MKSRLPIRRLYRTLVLGGAIPILLLAAVSCGRTSDRRTSETKQPASAPAVAFSFAQRIGWFQGPCLAISNPHLARGTSVALVIMGEPQKVQQVRSLEQTTDPAMCKALLQGRAKMNAKPGISFYTLEPGGVGATDMGIGIVEPPALTVADGLVRVDLDGDGQSEIFTSCATSEGIKFGVWTTKAYQGEPRWSGYYYLGYDLQPTCP